MGNASSEPVEVSTLFSGSVQGVGFRWQTMRVIEGLEQGGFRLDGFVRNLPDGRVELRLQGRADQVSAAIREVQRVMEDCIRSTESSRQDPGPPLGAFRIRH
ncbi:MAG: acylphosphatase [Planctomycetota bacterium]